MNKTLILGLLCAIQTVTNASHCQAIHNEIEGYYYQEESSLRSIIQKYLASIIPGIIVGANAGGFCAIFDHIMPPLAPVFWIGSYFGRKKMVDSISDDYKRRHIRHDKEIMQWCSLITTWLTYYKIYEAAHGSPPF